MNIKKTNSLIVGQEENRPQSEKAEEIHPNLGIQSQNAMSATTGHRFRFPQGLHDALRQTIQVPPLSKYKSDDVTGTNPMKTSKLGSILRSKIKDLRNITTCQICEVEIKKDQKQPLFLCQCQHKYNFCESCLHHYVIYKVKMFEQVACPREGCNTLIDTNALFFKQLPIDIQKSYKKLHQFYITANDPNKKLCPKQNCEGIISPSSDGVMVCSTCESEFCSKCLLARHNGPCDQHEVEFFQNNLHYRQCKKCRFVIQKNQGCNHMTCRCGYQFCYVCSAVWDPAHYGNHDENGNLIAAAAAQGAVYVPPPPQEPCCDCRCCQQICGQGVACVLKLPLKLLLIILFSAMMLTIFVCRDLLVILGMLLVTIMAGMFGFSFEVLSDLDGICCVLGVIFFPICMIVGIGVAFRQIFCDVVPDLCSDYWRMVQEGCEAICSI